MLGKLISVYRNEGKKEAMYHLKCIIRGLIAPIYMRVIELFVTPEKKIIFCNFAGKGYGGYPQVICEELIRRKSDVRLVWLIKEDSDFPPCIRKVRIDSYKALKELATAKLWIDNCRKPYFIRKSKRQFYLQTWHGGGPCLKVIEGDAKQYLSKSYIKDAMNDTKMADLFISDCEWQNELYKRAFWYNGEILNCGIPTNDIFYKDWKITKNKIFQFYGLDNDTHTILYAPTFRNNHSVECYDLDFERVIKACENRFGGSWVILVRIHPTMAERNSEIHYSNSIINTTFYPQIEELLIASDILVTDFSASMFLAFRWKIWSFLYASDYKEYVEKERPLYFDINKLPSSFSMTNEKLIEQIMMFSEEIYDKKCEDFCEEIAFFQGGKSIKMITDRIEKELG